jgi:hypothetical protein
MNGNVDALAAVLGVHEPVDARLAPPTLSFRRKRAVDIPWGEVLENLAPSGEVSIVALREYFEQSWGLAAPPDTAQLDGLSAGARARIVRVAPAAAAATDPAAAKAPEPAARGFHRTDLSKPATPAAAQITWAADETPPSDIALQHASGRWYLLQPRAGGVLHFESFITPAGYEAGWAQVEGADLVFTSAPEARSTCVRRSFTAAFANCCSSGISPRSSRRKWARPPRSPSSRSSARAWMSMPSSACRPSP